MLRRNAPAAALMLATTAAMAVAFKEWSATLNPMNGSTLSGTATAQPAVGDTLVVSVQVKQGTRGASNPWHVHAGGCDSSGAILGDPARYAPIVIGADLAGTASARVKAVLTVGVAYSVNVHRSPGDDQVIACGNLRPIAGGDIGEPK
ncbi:MAG TPA: hypothetical protein VFZ73_07935 [Gemmatimonadaceae bacterium]